MLEFFRNPEFWVLLAGLMVLMGLNGFCWASGRRAAAASMLVAGIAIAVWLAVKLGIVAGAVATITGVIVAALGLEVGGDRAPSHAVVLDSATDSARSADSGPDIRLAS